MIINTKRPKPVVIDKSPQQPNTFVQPNSRNATRPSSRQPQFSLQGNAMNRDNNYNDHCDKNELKLHKLCADHVSSCRLKSNHVVSNDLCSQVVNIKSLSVESEIANNLCVPGSITASQVWADKSNFNTLCAKDAVLNKVCINDLTVANWQACVSERATINFLNNVTYTLGTDLNFDNIVDDPNGNVSLVPNTSYTAPVSGYYMLSYKVNVTNLQSTNGPVLGVPVSVLEVYANGQLIREDYKPFLSFFNEQRALMSSLSTLQAGDVVTLKYKVLGGNGLPVVGTVDIIGTGIEDGHSFFKTILLSGLCENPSVECAPCPTVGVPCQFVSTPCAPVDNCCGESVIGMQRHENAFNHQCASCK